MAINPTNCSAFNFASAADQPAVEAARRAPSLPHSLFLLPHFIWIFRVNIEALSSQFFLVVFYS